MAPKKILIIYTGGTIGMMQPPDQSYLRPVDFNNLRHYVPEIERLTCEIEFFFFEEPIDSSNMEPSIWARLASIIERNYELYDGFVILHGTDTMSYTASALSFMLEGLTKPVALTGAQLPVAVIRTDARENLITAVEIVSHMQYTLPEVFVVFDAKALRGNRSIKYSSEKFQAFISPNYPPLAEAGVDMEFYTQNWLKPRKDARFRTQKNMPEVVGLLKFYPGIPRKMVELVVGAPDLRAVILETYGAGSLPDFRWLIDCLKERIDDGLVVLNVTQCTAGKVAQERYKNSNMLLEIGVISGKDVTTSAATAKLMYLYGKYGDDLDMIRRQVVENLRGEIIDG